MVVPNFADMAGIACAVCHCDWAKVGLDIDLVQVALYWQMTVDLWMVLVHNCLGIVDEAGSFLGNIVAVVAAVDMAAYFVDRSQGFAPNPVPFYSHAYEEAEVVIDSYLALTYCSQIDLGEFVAVVVVTLVIVVVVEDSQTTQVAVLVAVLVAEIAVEHRRHHHRQHRQLVHYCHVTYDLPLLVAFADPIEIDYSMDAI